MHFQYIYLSNKQHIILISQQQLKVQYSLNFQMFSKLKSIFTDQNNPESPSMSQTNFKHPQMEGGDVSQCPFMNKNKSNPQSSKCPNSKAQAKNSKKDLENSSQSQAEPEQKPKGGCPFMAPSGPKKNPNLGLSHLGYPQPFPSPYKYYLSQSKLNFQALRSGSASQPIVRHVFNQYPIYLQHTLFYNGDDYKKVRGLECCSRFLAYEELRERGNKYFNKGKYMKAIGLYERAMSLFRWLEFWEDKQDKSQADEKMGSQLMIEESQSQISDNQSMSKIPINVNMGASQKKNQENDFSFLHSGPQNKQFDEFTQKYKQFFVIYHDENTKYHNGQEMTEEVDLDMRKSLLVQIYLNMAAAYIHCNHFELADQVLEDAEKLSNKVSQIYLRKAQVKLAKSSSTLQQLHLALQQISKAVEMQPNEKIFQNTNINILKMVNIHDAKQVYSEVRQQLLQKISLKKQKQSQLISQFSSRLGFINKVEQQMIKQGKSPKQGPSSLLSECSDYRILKRIYDKYVRIIDFYTEAKDKNQLKLAHKEFQEIVRTISQIQEIEELDFELRNQQFGRDLQKIQRRLKNIKKQKCEQIYNTAKYNFHVLQWAIKQIVDEQHKQKERKKKEEEQRKKAEKQQMKRRNMENTINGLNGNGEVEDAKGNGKGLIGKLPYAMVIVPVIGFVISYLI